MHSEHQQAAWAREDHVPGFCPFTPAHVPLTQPAEAHASCACASVALLSRSAVQSQKVCTTPLHIRLSHLVRDQTCATPVPTHGTLIWVLTAPLAHLPPGDHQGLGAPGAEVPVPQPHVQR